MHGRFDFMRGRSELRIRDGSHDAREYPRPQPKQTLMLKACSAFPIHIRSSIDPALSGAAGMAWATAGLPRCLRKLYEVLEVSEPLEYTYYRKVVVFTKKCGARS